ncbi:Ger(x)C family spore germination protein [Paenibacillus sp. SI8]|uniref:Ger(x)C family spore germination protein n=1 Tax=unclassified Paenibacillus TaxID=185978 RepID=UPI003466E294
MIRKGWLICIVICTLLWCSGCMDIVELREQSFIVGLGIDLAENNQIEVSLAEINIQNGGAEQASPDKSTPLIVKSATGKNISECIRILRTEQFKKLTLNKVSYIVFSDKLAKKGLIPYKDFLVRSNELDLSTQLFVSEARVKDLFEADRGKLLEFTTKGYKYLPTFIPSYLWQLLSRMETPLESTFLNRVRLGDDTLAIEGEAFMKMDKLKVSLNYKETRGVNILLDKKWKNILLFINDAEDTSFLIKRVQRKDHYAPNHVTLTYTISGNIVESTIENPMAKVQQLEKNGSDSLAKKITDLLKKNTNEGIDILGIGEKFRQRGWDTSNWQQRIKDLPIDIRVNLRILDGEALKD